MPVLILFVTCICWGVSFPLGRALLLSQEGLASTWGLVSASLFLRFIIAAIVVGWWILRHGQAVSSYSHSAETTVLRAPTC